MGDDRDGKLGRRAFNKAVAGTLAGTELASGASVVVTQFDTPAGEEIWRLETGDSVLSSLIYQISGRGS